jgi:transposase
MTVLIDGERVRRCYVEPNRGSLRCKTACLTEALTGRCSEHHAFLLT